MRQRGDNGDQIMAQKQMLPCSAIERFPDSEKNFHRFLKSTAMGIRRSGACIHL
jgi:hypothetical protein